MEEPHSLIHFSVHREVSGQSNVEVVDPVGRRVLWMPACLIDELETAFPDQIVSTLREVDRRLRKTGRSFGFTARRPAHVASIFAQDFVERLSERFGGTVADRNVWVSEASDSDLLIFEIPAITHDRVRWCHELRLHQWNQAPHRAEWFCAVCGAAGETEPRARPLIKLVSPVWTAATTSHGRRTFETFLRHAPPSASWPEMRILHAAGLRAVSGEAMEALEYLTFLVGREEISIRRTAIGHDLDSTLASVPEVMLTEDLNVDGTVRVTLQVPEHPLLTSVDVVRDRKDVQRLADRLGGGNSGQELALAALTGAAYAQATVTLEDALLSHTENHRLWSANLMTPRAAARFVGLFLRHRNRVPIPGVGFSITRRQFQESVPLALAPELARPMSAAIAMPLGRKRDLMIRLLHSTLARLTSMRAAEDEIAFTSMYSDTGAAPDATYHLEYLLFLAQATLEGLKGFASMAHSLPKNPKWGEFLAKLTRLGSPMADFLKTEPSAHLLSLISLFRDPLAHHMKWAVTHVAQPEGTQPYPILLGRHAERALAAIVGLGDAPIDWGIRGGEIGPPRLEVRIEAYPFAVQLNGHLQRFVRDFLEQLTPMIDRSGHAQLIEPWLFHAWPSNPRVDEVVRLLSWPMP